MTSETMLMPKIVYGLAWKKEATTQLVIQAVKAGFRGIDTAGQWKVSYITGICRRDQVHSEVHVILQHYR